MCKLNVKILSSTKSQVLTQKKMERVIVWEEREIRKEEGRSHREKRGRREEPDHSERRWVR